jgi:5-methylcytosine-specific restriction endonuclease McrA
MCNETTRQCRICTRILPTDKFEIDSRKKDKRTSRCYECKYASDDKAQRAYRSLKSRSLKQGVPVEVSAKEIRLLFEMLDSCCAYCGKRPAKEHNLHLEHIVPLSENGRSTLANLLPACSGCNISKSNKPLVTHFFDNRDRFPDSNFALVVDYMSILTGVKKEEVVAEMTDDHVKYLMRQSQLELENEKAKEEKAK